MTRRVKGSDYCALAFFSSLVINKVQDDKSYIDIVITNDERGFPTDETDPNYWNDLKEKIHLQQFSEGSNNPEDIVLTLDENFKVHEDPGGSNTTVTFIGLNPGRKYLVNFAIDGFVTFPIVPSCSCEAITGQDQTGRPKDLTISQNRGYVLFNFLDNSKCESGFSFSRFEGYAEFVDDSSRATSFTNDFSYQAPRQCTSRITPEIEASDDLTMSRLVVGNVYSYCVRSIREGNYMDVTVNAKEMRALASSSAICSIHRINWESSMFGKVTTDPDAGSIAIQDVDVRWQLLSEDGKELQCVNCSGATKTNKGGSFEIHVKVEDEPLLYGKNDEDIPIKLFFSKFTRSNENEIKHRFLCNDGQDICNDETGFVTYLKHLHFDTPFHAYDDTSVPFTGKLIIHGTQCPIVGANVCPQHHSVAARNNEQNVGILCVKTDSNGEYIAPAVIGSVIYGVRIEHEGHDFERTFDNKWNYDAGVHITETGFYASNDFYDISKARLFVQGQYRFF